MAILETLTPAVSGDMAPVPGNDINVVMPEVIYDELANVELFADPDDMAQDTKDVLIGLLYDVILTVNKA